VYSAASADISRSSSTARTNDRLQERLARALAKKSSEGRNDSPSSTADPVSRTATPIEKSADEHTQQPKNQPSTDDAHNTQIPGIATDDAGPVISAVSENGKVDQEGLPGACGILQKQSASVVSQVTTPARLSLDEESRNQKPDIIVNGNNASHELASSEEMYAYIEKIDALQAKLQYLTKEAVTSAHDAAAAAKAGSAEKKLLEKDEKIALLMDEGQKLSKTEMKHLMVIKNLRSQAAEGVRIQSSIKARAEKAEASLSSAEQRASRAEAAMRRAEENLEFSLSADRDAEALKHERDALASTVAEIRAQLAHANRRAESAENKAQSDALAKEKKQIASLQDDLTSIRVEREISEEKLRREVRDLKALLEREREHSTSLEGELRAEQSLLESKMESLRYRAEEASSSNVGDSQAKLLRQIETLQNQYAVASENWQGIEGSLLARLASVEKERDGLEQHEGDLRKKVREATQKAKSAERENEASRDVIYRLEQSISDQNSQIHHLQRQLKETEDSLASLRRDLEAQQRHEGDLSRRIDEERNKWKEQILAQSPTMHRNESPMDSTRKSSGLGLGLEHMAGAFATAERGQSRRSSIFPNSFRASNTPPRQNSPASFQPSSSINGAVPETPASQLLNHDDYFPESTTPASLGAHNGGVNDLISVSTVGAGPSVQLVERMSASVRRLESEKAASRDDFARLTAQRDASRQEVVSLMREVEQKRASDERVRALEEELDLLSARHHTTLEMLGEKSELVEELRADVADVKQMYRDLVDRTMK
jgi:TATA element modulatory factor